MFSLVTLAKGKWKEPITVLAQSEWTVGSGQDSVYNVLLSVVFFACIRKGAAHNLSRAYMQYLISK